jgi:hypothetical protein
MTTYQTASNILVALKRESTVGTAAGASGGTQMRVLASPGLSLKRANIQSAEKRTDMLRSMPRLGGKMVDGSYNAELTVGGATDILAEAIMRSTWSAALTTAASSFTTLTPNSTSTLTAASGSFLTTGIRVGDVVYLTGTATAANNNLNLRVVGVSASVITVAGTPLTVAGPDATGSLVRLKKVINGATPTRYAHTVEQYNTDIDLSEQFLGCRLVGLKLSFKPGAMATVQYTFLGLDRVPLGSGSSPYFTSPALTTGLDLIADDSSIRFNGAEVATFTGFDLDFAIAAKGEPVIGSFVSPDIFDNDLTVTGSITGLRSDFSNLTLYDAETEFDLSILLQEPTGTPKGAFGIYLGRAKIGDVGAPILGDGPLVETRSLLIGPKVAATGYDAGYASFSSSAP